MEALERNSLQLKPEKSCRFTCKILYSIRNWGFDEENNDEPMDLIIGFNDAPPKKIRIKGLSIIKTLDLVLIKSY